MAETKLINFRYGTYDEINGLGKDANCIYFASDKPLFYAVGKWHGIASMVSEVDRVNSKTILKINGDGGYAINCEIEGETLSKDLKDKLINAYEFVQLISGEDEDVIINKWNEIVAFLQGFGEADKLLNVVVELQNNLADEVANRISADQKHTEDIKSITDLVNDMFTLVDKGDGTKYIQSKYGFASDSFISARGVDNESSGVGCLDAQQLWNELMTNTDATKIINVSHIPDITVAKITDFTAKVGDLIANKADKATTLSGYGITDAVTLNTEQTITGVKIFSNLRVNNSTMVTNLNAEMVGGYIAGDLLTSYIADFDLNQKFPLKKAGPYLVRIQGSAEQSPNLPAGFHYGNLLHLEAYGSDNAFELLGDGYNKKLLYRSGSTVVNYSNYLGNQSWKTVAFTDTNSLTPSGGILTINGELTATSIEGDLKPTLITGDVVQEAKPNRFFTSKSSATNLPNGEHYLTGFSLLQNEDANYKSIFAISSQNNVYVKTTSFEWVKLVQENSSVIFKNITANYISVNGSIDIGTNAHIYGKLTVANQLTIGNATLYWDVANQCLRVNTGLASDAFLSAKGIDTTGNGQGGGGGFDAQMLWNELTIPSPTNSGKVISSQFLPVLTSAKISDFDSAVATAMASTLADISSSLSNHEQRLQAIEQALTWQGVS